MKLLPEALCLQKFGVLRYEISMEPCDHIFESGEIRVGEYLSCSGCKKVISGSVSQCLKCGLVLCKKCLNSERTTEPDIKAWLLTMEEPKK